MKSNFFLLLILVLTTLLRFYRVESVPPGLAIDEVSIGYNAYLILKNGVDEHGEKYPLWFAAFGEYKLPVYIYFTSGSIYLLGKNEFAIRFPSIFLGTATIMIAYFLAKEFFNRSFSLLAMLLLAISPWHLQFSRAAFEATAGLFFFLSASWLMVLFWKKNSSFFLVSGFIIYILTIYTYNAYRLITPVVLVVLTVKIFQKFPRSRAALLSTIILSSVLILPFSRFLFSQKGTIRFLQTSMFINYQSATFGEKLIIYPLAFLKNYLSFFSFPFLFNSGDGIGRHQIPNFGVLFRWQFPFLIAGAGFLLLSKRSLFKNIIFWLAILSPIPASISLPSPHALRSFLLVVPFTLTISLGIVFIFKSFKKWAKVVLVFLVLLAVYEFSFYLHYYFFHYPKTNLIDWGGAYKQMVKRTAEYQNRYPVIVVSKFLNQSYIYFLFYEKRLSPIFVDIDWKKPKQWEKVPVLYLTPYIRKGDSQPSNKLLEVILLPNLNKDVFAQFWEI